MLATSHTEQPKLHFVPADVQEQRAEDLIVARVKNFNYTIEAGLTLDCRRLRWWARHMCSELSIHVLSSNVEVCATWKSSAQVTSKSC